MATGGVSASWTPKFRSDGLFQYSDRNWHVPALPESANDIADVKDIMDVSIDPTDPTHVVFSSYEEGLLELRDGEIVRVLNATNSSIELSEVGGSPRSAVSGVDFDTDGNLWFTTPWTTNCLHVLTPDGETTSMNLGEEGQSLLFGDVEVTRDGYVWVVLPRGKGVLVYNPAGTPTFTGDDNWTILTIAQGKGGLPSNDVFCIEEDLDEEIWVGTANGPCVFYQSSTVFGDDVNASQILISQDGNLQYLLETDVIQSIIIDAGNRKWVGTAGSGVYVLAADGLTTDHHFTVDNSPLPSNDISRHRHGLRFGRGLHRHVPWPVVLPRRGHELGPRNDRCTDHAQPHSRGPLWAHCHRRPRLPKHGSHHRRCREPASRKLRSDGGRATWDGLLGQRPTRPLRRVLGLCHGSRRQGRCCCQICHHPLSMDRPRLPRSKMPHVGTTIFTEMSALATECDALNIAQGFPDLPTPPELRQAVAYAIESGHNQYAPMPGNPELRRWLADVYHRGAGYDPDTEITIGAGASSVLFAAMTALLHPGDEVVVQDPCYDLYAPVAELNHATVVRVPLLDAEGQMNAHGLADAVGPRTRMVILNSPHNPHRPRHHTEDAGRLVRRHGRHRRMAGQRRGIRSHGPR